MHVQTTGRLSTQMGRRPKLDATLIIDSKEDEEEGDVGEGLRQPRRCPLFALVSLNAQAAPSAEVPWSHLLALSMSPEGNSEPLLTLGRHKDCSVFINDPRVSLRHFEIIARPQSQRETLWYECILNDMSSNGTAVNGQTIGKGKSVHLRSGDEICVLPAHRVGEAQMISFVFRNTTESLQAPKDVRALDLDDLVLCPICMHPIYKCVALMPCLHNFCMACYSEWMFRKDDCPVCRRAVSAVIKNHPMEAIVEAFLKAKPERRRPHEELEEMDRRDRLKLSAGGRIVRDTCSVGTSTSAGEVGTHNSTGDGGALQRAVNGVRLGSQICAVQ